MKADSSGGRSNVAPQGWDFKATPSLSASESMTGQWICSASCVRQVRSSETSSRPCFPPLCPLHLQPSPSTCDSVLSKLLCFISVFFLLAEKLLLGLKRHQANHRYERDTLRREQINPLCRENSSFLECLFWKCHFNGSQNSWIKSHPYFRSKRNKDLLSSLTRKAVLTHRWVKVYSIAWRNIYCF